MNFDSESTEGTSVKDLIQALPDETPSMAWRSELNEKLRVQVVRRERRRNFFKWMKPALGLATAGIGAGFFFMASTPMMNSKPGLEADLINEYRRASATSIVAGPTAGMNVGYSPAPAAPHEADIWDQVGSEDDISL